MEEQRKSEQKNAAASDPKTYEAVSSKQPVDLETAIAACEYGKFNYLVLLGLIPMTSAQSWAMNSTSFVMPSAQCDLDLNQVQKGMLNSALFAGNILASLLWGFVGDKLGRMKLLLGAFFFDSAFNVGLAFSNSFWMYFFMKLVTGITIAAPNSLLHSYVAETHTNDRRAQAIMLVGTETAMSSLLLPVIAYFVLPLDTGEFASWRIFHLICAIPSLIAGLCCLMLPESPKFLFSKGRIDEGLLILRKMYTCNTGKKPDTYPFAAVLRRSAEGQDQDTSCGFWTQFRIIFQRPYLARLAILIVIQMCLMGGSNPMRMWTPQLFAYLEQYEKIQDANKRSNLTICGVIGATLNLNMSKQFANGSEVVTCIPSIGGEVYLRSLVISGVHIALFLIASPLVKQIGQRALLMILFPTAAACIVAVNWIGSADWLMSLLSLYSPMSGVSINALSSIQVDAFPTSIRAVALSVIRTCGRIASLLGNIILAALLDTSCHVVFFYLGATLFVCFLLAWFLPQSQESR